LAKDEEEGEVRDYLMDISKYIVTGFVLTAFFDEFSEYRWLI